MCVWQLQLVLFGSCSWCCLAASAGVLCYEIVGVCFSFRCSVARCLHQSLDSTRLCAKAVRAHLGCNVWWSWQLHVQRGSCKGLQGTALPSRAQACALLRFTVNCSQPQKGGAGAFTLCLLVDCCRSITSIVCRARGSSWCTVVRFDTCCLVVDECWAGVGVWCAALRLIAARRLFPLFCRAMAGS